MKRLNDSTWASVKCGMVASILTAFIIGCSLIEKDSSPHFFTLYYTRAVPVGLTIGGLTFCIVEMIKHKKASPVASSKEERE